MEAVSGPIGEDKGGHKHLPNEIVAREADAVQRAHDLLTSVVLGEVPVKLAGRHYPARRLARAEAGVRWREK